MLSSSGFEFICPPLSRPCCANRGGLTEKQRGGFVPAECYLVPRVDRVKRGVGAGALLTHQDAAAAGQLRHDLDLIAQVHLGDHLGRGRVGGSARDAGRGDDALGAKTDAHARALGRVATAAHDDARAGIDRKAPSAASTTSPSKKFMSPMKSATNGVSGRS